MSLHEIIRAKQIGFGAALAVNRDRLLREQDDREMARYQRACSPWGNPEYLDEIDPRDEWQATYRYQQGY